MKRVSRRDFLKLASLSSLSLAGKSLLSLDVGGQGQSSPNVIILVFDAWSAGHTSLYGYPRETMPKLSRFAERANVYHNHITAGTFTATGTASLLTGLYPWTHRALHIRSGITAEQVDNQFFAALQASHNSLAYSQNRYADKFVYQMGASIDRHLSSSAFNIQRQSVYNLPLFRKDGEMAYAAFEENLFNKVDNYDASLFLAPLQKLISRYDRSLLQQIYAEEYPKGMPDSFELFLLADAVDGAIENVKNLDKPFLAYLHFFPPHWPYQPKQGFFKKFRNGWAPDVTGPHPLTSAAYSDSDLLGAREKYDEYLASWDDEMGRFFDYLHDSGLFDRSIVVITSDHGEMFERGVSGHTTPLIFDPLVRVPLIVSTPGQQDRIDIHANTSCTDILPTIAHLTGQPLPDWGEGEILPGLGGSEDHRRSVYVLDAKQNSAFGPLTQFSISMTRGRYRLTYYQYPGYEAFEFYDLQADPRELWDLYPSRPRTALDMQEELLEKIHEVNRPYLTKGPADEKN